MDGRISREKIVFEEHSYYQTIEISSIEGSAYGIQLNNIEAEKKCEPYQCTICSKTFNLKFVYTEHMRIHEGCKPYQCKICQRTFTQYSTLRSHSLVHFGPRPYYCDLCRLTFNTGSKLIKHKLFHKKIKKFECAICGKSFLRLSILKKHITSHLYKKPYTCSHCERSFTQKINLILHQSVHTGIKEFKCDICAKEFRLKKYLVSHVRFHFKSQIKQIRCKFCGMLFDDERLWKVHALVHSGGEPFLCQQCGFCFRNKACLDVHLISHDFKPFQCDLCNSSFSHAIQLETHQSVHFIGDKYSCGVCEKSFITFLPLKKHITQTHGDKILLCKHCDKYFPNNFLLKSHIDNSNVALSSNVNVNKFTYSKLFKCEHCSLTLTNYDDFLKHLLNHGKKFTFDLEENALYECHECLLICESYINLLKHIVEIHCKEVDEKFTCEFCDEEFANKKAAFGHIKEHLIEFDLKGFEKSRLDLKEAEIVNLIDGGDDDIKIIRQVKAKKTTKRGRRFSFCNICKRKFKNSRSLSNHVKIHNCHNCDLCEATFKSLAKLKNHVLEHFTFDITNNTIGHDNWEVEYLSTDNEG